MSERLIKELLPGERIKHADLHEGNIMGFSCVAWIAVMRRIHSLPLQPLMETRLSYFTILTLALPWSGMLVN